MLTEFLTSLGTGLTQGDQGSITPIALGDLYTGPVSGPQISTGLRFGSNSSLLVIGGIVLVGLFLLTRKKRGK